MASLKQIAVLAYVIAPMFPLTTTNLYSLAHGSVRVVLLVALPIA